MGEEELHSVKIRWSLLPCVLWKLWFYRVQKVNGKIKFFAIFSREETKTQRLLVVSTMSNRLFVGFRFHRYIVVCIKIIISWFMDGFALITSASKDFKNGFSCQDFKMSLWKCKITYSCQPILHDVPTAERFLPFRLICLDSAGNFCKWKMSLGWNFRFFFFFFFFFVIIVILQNFGG